MTHNENNLSVGRAYLAAKNFKMAGQYADEILLAYPDNEEAGHLKFDILFHEQKYPDALQFAKRWLANKPNSPVAHFGIVCSFLKLNKNKSALEALEIFKATLPSETEAIAIADFIYQQQAGSNKQVEKVLSALQKTAPDGVLDLIEGQQHYRNNHLLAAMDCFKQIIKKNNDDYGSYRFLAFTAYRLMHFSTARNAAKQALRINPSALFMRETIVLSRLVYFPPFLLAHSMTTLTKLAIEKVGDWGIIAFVAFVFTYLYGFENYVSPQLPDGFGIVFNALAVSYFIYLEFLYAKNWLAIKVSKQEVTLKNY